MCRRTSKMKTNVKVLFLSLISLSLAGCNTSGYEGGGWYKPEGKGTGDDEYALPTTPGSGAPAASAAAGSEKPGDSAGDEGSINPQSSHYQIPAGQITASALDDNKYYDYWKELLGDAQNYGPFYHYRKTDDFVSQNRVSLTINNANDAYVTIKNESKVYHVNNFHKAYLFPKNVSEEYEVTISYKDAQGNRKNVDKVVKDNDVIDLDGEYTTSKNLEIMFVIDATGSMSDEMRYLKAEINDVIGKVREANEGSTVSLAMMVYRDVRDEYVTRYSDFTENIADQQEFLSRQNAAGGGDIEEAVETALDEAINKQWSADSTKLLFHVADAPAHEKDADIRKWSNAIDKAAEKGISVMSVAASGIDKRTEFYFRSQSLITGGQYIFITDDSGIGNSHEKPTIQEKLTVEYLNQCIIRLINGYHTGNLEAPVPYTQVNNQQQ